MAVGSPLSTRDALAGTGALTTLTDQKALSVEQHLPTTGQLNAPSVPCRRRKPN